MNLYLIKQIFILFLFKFELLLFTWLIMLLIYFISQYSEHEVDSNASEVSVYNLRPDYSYDDVPNEVSISAAGKYSSMITSFKVVF